MCGLELVPSSWNKQHSCLATLYDTPSYRHWKSLKLHLEIQIFNKIWVQLDRNSKHAWQYLWCENFIHERCLEKIMIWGKIGTTVTVESVYLWEYRKFEKSIEVSDTLQLSCRLGIYQDYFRPIFILAISNPTSLFTQR